MKSEKFNIALGKNIKDAREKKNLRQEHLAEKADLSRATIANIEAGRQNVTVINLAAIADVLDVSAESLIPKFSENVEPPRPAAKKELFVEGRDRISETELHSLAKKFKLPIKGA